MRIGEVCLCTTKTHMIIYIPYSISNLIMNQITLIIELIFKKEKDVRKKKEENPNLTFEEILPMIKENFGLLTADDEVAAVKENQAFVLSDYELAKLQAGFEESMKAVEDRISSEENDLLYGGYDPLSVSLTHILNNKAGIGWTSYAHTGTPVAVYAMGVGSEKFSGFYDNTDVYHKLVEVTGLKE